MDNHELLGINPTIISGWGKFRWWSRDTWQQDTQRAAKSGHTLFWIFVEHLPPPGKSWTKMFYYF